MNLEPLHSDPLLTRDALQGIRIAISASESPDLHRLGLVETHFRLALAEIGRSVLTGGGKIAYGGHLDPNGYTPVLLHELQRFSRRDQPLQICLAWQEHRKLSRQDFFDKVTELGLIGEILRLDTEGNVLPIEQDWNFDAQEIIDEDVRRKSLTSLRRYMAKNSNGRVLIGGKKLGFQGSLPGLIEEALLSIENNQPLYLAGGFGGITSDIIVALKVDDGDWLPSIENDVGVDDRLKAGLEKLSEIGKSSDWRGLGNGLTEDENRRLAATHRPTEIAALVSLGLGRRFANKDV